MSRPSLSARAFNVPMAFLSSIIVATLASVQSDFGFLSFDSDAVIELALPIAGTMFALALPAVQLAESVKERILFEGDSLIRSEPAGELDAVSQYLDSIVERYRQDLHAMQHVIQLSLASFLVGVAGALGFADGVRYVGRFAGDDFVACLAMSLLVVSALRFLPVVRSSFDLTRVDGFLHALRNSIPRNAQADTRTTGADRTPPDHVAPISEGNS